MYLSIMHASEATYNSICLAILHCFPESKLLSYYKVRNLIADITGVVSVSHHMCISSCMAYTGPFKDLEECQYCQEPRYDQEQLRRNGEKVSRQKFSTTLLGPQLAAIRCSPEGAKARMYCDEKLREINEMIDSLGNGGNMVYDDIWCGQDVWELVDKVRMTDNDAAVSMSLNGAQLYQNKKSDCWIGIWVIQDYAPNARFKKKRILPNTVIPGPNKPKHTDSFLFPGLHHLSALQHENNGRGVRVWDAAKEEVVYQQVIFLLLLTDALGLVEVDRHVSHHGAHGCRLGCEMKGCHKANSGHYYAAHAQPLHCTIPDNAHEDTNIEILETQSSALYEEKISRLRASSGPMEYTQNRKDTGLSKPSILSGLDPRFSLSVPKCFGLNLMHLLCLNLEDLLLCLWRGTIKCEPTDDQKTWEWVKLVGETWEKHGELVENTTQYFPSSFQRPPRNPAKKLSSGYKATEYYLYVFGLGPGLF